MRLSLGLFCFVCVSCAQQFSYGVAIGTALTDDFAYRAPGGAPLFAEGIRSAGKSVIVGPVLQWNFTPHFAVAASGLFRELKFDSESVGSGNSNPTITWEFPILARYTWTGVHAGNGRVRPFLEGGPSLRTTGNRNTTPSHSGGSVGGGVEVHWNKISVTPTVR